MIQEVSVALVPSTKEPIGVICQYILDIAEICSARSSSQMKNTFMFFEGVDAIEKLMSGFNPCVAFGSI